MTRPLRALHDDALAAALRDAGRTLPGARRDIAAALTPASLAARQGVARRLRRPPSRRAVLVAAALLLVAAGSALAAGVVPGIELRRSPQQTDTTGPPLVSDDAFLGTRTTLRAARATVDFPIRVPELPGHPQVYVAGTRGRQRVSLLYGASDDLPPIGPTRAGLLVTQFRGHADDAVLRKIAGPGVDVAAVSVGDAPAWWISGAHEVAVLDGDRVVTERVRYADRTLLWSLDGVTLRVEAAVPRAQAIALAASMR